MKVIKILTILLLLTLFFKGAFVSSAEVNVVEKCRGASTFTNWNECLNLKIGDIDKFYFINGFYTEYFKGEAGISINCPADITDTTLCNSNVSKEALEAAFNKTIAAFIKDLVVSLLLVFLLVLVVIGIKASFDYINAGDNDDKIALSKKAFTNIIKGLVIVIIAFVVTEFFAVAFGIPNIWEIKLFAIFFYFPVFKKKH